MGKDIVEIIERGPGLEDLIADRDNIDGLRAGSLRAYTLALPGQDEIMLVGIVYTDECGALALAGSYRASIPMDALDDYCLRPLGDGETGQIMAKLKTIGWTVPGW